MKINDRIMISNIFLVLLSLVCLLAVISIIAFLPGDPGKEVLDSDIFRVGEILGRFDASAKDWDALNDRLSVYGYKLLVFENDTIVFSALNDLQGEIISLKRWNPGKASWREKHKI